jgi:hypothetical protein
MTVSNELLDSLLAQWERSCDFAIYKITLIVRSNYHLGWPQHSYNSPSFILARPCLDQFME